MTANNSSLRIQTSRSNGRMGVLYWFQSLRFLRKYRRLLLVRKSNLKSLFKRMRILRIPKILQIQLSIKVILMIQAYLRKLRSHKHSLHKLINIQFKFLRQRFPRFQLSSKVCLPSNTMSSPKSPQINPLRTTPPRRPIRPGSP